MKIMKVSRVMLAMFVLFGMIAFVSSCKKDSDPISGEVSLNAKSEASEDAQQDEVDDMTTAALGQSDPNPAGKAASDPDSRFSCAYVTFEPNADSTGGTLTINFDLTPSGEPNPDGCTDPRGNVRKGMITITWTGGRWYVVGSVITVNLINYSINGVVLNGSRTLSNITTNVLKPTWTIESNINVTFPNSATANRQVHKTRQWDILAGEIIVTQTDGADFAASGTNRRGVLYTMEITSPLIFKLSCIHSNKVYIPVQGTKVLKFNGKTVTIDYGNGECDNRFTVTIEGRSDSFDASNGSED